MNLVIVTGTVVSAAERTVGQTGRVLTELRLAVTRPGRAGDGEASMVVPVTVWGERGRAVRTLPEGAAITVTGHLRARAWQEKLFIDLIAETVALEVGMPERPDPSRRPAARRPRDPDDSAAF